MISLIRAAWQEEMRVPMFVGLATDGYPDSDDPAMKNGARCYHMDTGAEYEYSKDDDAWYPVPSGGGGASSWSSVTGKPFETIGEGLTVDEDGALNAGGWPADLPKPSVGGYGYTEQGEQTVIVDNESITTVDRGNVCSGQFATPFDIVDGAYTVIFNGTEYNLNSAFFEERGFWYLGDVSSSGVDFSRYPFTIASMEGQGTVLFTESAGDYEVTVKKSSPSTVHPIDPKYLPPESKLPEVTSEDDGKFMRVVDGEWAATQVTTKTMEVTYDDDTTETFNIFVEGN